MKLLKRQLKSLDAKGLSHIIVPLGIVILVAIVGTFLVVASHADPVKGKSAVSGPTTPKKVAYVNVENFTLTSSMMSMQSQILSRTVPIQAADCVGYGIVSVSGPGGVIAGSSLDPTWNGNTCLMNMSSISGPFKPGRYSIRVSFSGNATTKAYRHSTFYRTVPKPKPATAKS